MQPDRQAGQRQRASGPGVRARREAARAEAIQRLARWKRAIGAAAVVAFGALVGLIGVAGARGHDNPAGTAPRSPSAASQLIPRDDDGFEAEPGTAPDDGYFGRGDGGYGFGRNSSRSGPLGSSSVS